MDDSRPTRHYRNLLRFYRYGLPYWKTILLAFACMMLYAALGVNAMLLLRPFMDSFQVGAAGQAPPAAALVQGAAKPDAEAPAEGLKERVKTWFLALPVVHQVTGWLMESLSLRRVAAVLVFLIGPLFVLSGFFQAYLSARVVWSVLADVRVAVFDHLTEMSLSYYAHMRSGDLLSRLTYDISRTEAALKVIFGKMLLQPLMALLFLAVALWHSAHLTLMVVVTVPVLVFIVGRYGRRIRRYATKMLQSLADVTDSVAQLLDGIRVVKSFHMEQAEKEMFRERIQVQLRKAFKLVRSEAWASVLPQFVIGVFTTALLLLMADRLFKQGQLDVQDMLICAVSLAALSGRVRRITKAYSILQRSMAGVNRVFELIDAQPDIVDSPDAVDLSDVGEGIEFHNASFAYDDEPVVKDVNLFVPAGRTYAIVGETGAGKSTLLDLIPRFYDVTSGSVTIAGVDVRRVKRESLMRLIAIVGQHPFLFNRSIIENIRYGDPDATDEEVHAAARAANIDHFIRSLPDGYDTLAGEAGDRFSGGQRQCITIARAILKNAPILILDEATSSLDAESESLVQQALKALMTGRTTLVIAHRLSTVRHADRIVVLRDGRVREQGTHEELIAARGEYFRLCRLQFADDGTGDAQPATGAADDDSPQAGDAPPVSRDPS